MPTQSNKNYTAIEVLKGQMKNLNEKVDSLETTVVEGFRDLKNTFASKESAVGLEKRLDGLQKALLALNMVIITTIIGTLIARLFN